METVENLVKGGLGFVGLNTPLNRFAAVTFLGVVLEFAFKPSWAFNSVGEIRPPVFMKGSENTTLVPIGVVPSILGIAAAQFI